MINLISILDIFYIYFIKFQIISFNKFQNHKFQRNSNVKNFYETALHLAVQFNNTEIIKVLLENKNIDIYIDYARNDEIKLS